MNRRRRTVMRQLPLFVVVLLLAGRGLLAADDLPRPNSPALDFTVPDDGKERCKMVEGPDNSAGRPAIEVHGETSPTLTTIAEVNKPPVESHQYVVRGRVKYDRVAGVAYLEMWNHFGSRGSAFSRTLGEVGTMKSISGDSD